MNWLQLALGFLAFMALIGTVQAVDRRAEAHYGYRPFAPTNLAFMLVPHGLLAAWLTYDPATAGAVPLTPPLVWGLAALGAVLCLVLFLILLRRTTVWLGLFGVCVMTLGASVLLLSVLFSDLSRDVCRHR